MTRLLVRDWQPGDLSRVWAINQAAVPATNALPQEELGRLMGQALAGLVAIQDGQVGGVMICLGEDADYTSENFLWLKNRYDRFAYVDRVAVDPALRGAGIGAALYDEVERRLKGLRAVLTCEVNSLPPNPGSLRFHLKRGFGEVGRASVYGGEKEVIYLAKPLAAC